MAKKSSAPAAAGILPAAEAEDFVEQLAAELDNQAPAADQPPPAEPPAETNEPATVLLELPVGPPPLHGYQTDHVDVRLNAQQRRGLHQLLHGLRDRHAQLKSGRHVEKIAHAVQWVCEQVAEQLAPAP